MRLWWCTRCAGDGVDKAANESQAADWSCGQHSSSTSAHGPSASRAAVLFQQRRCGVTLSDCCCGSRDVAASHSQTAVAAAETLRRHTLRLLLRQQGRVESEASTDRTLNPAIAFQIRARPRSNSSWWQSVAEALAGVDRSCGWLLSGSTLSDGTVLSVLELLFLKLFGCAKPSNTLGLLP